MPKFSYFESSVFLAGFMGVVVEAKLQWCVVLLSKALYFPETFSEWRTWKRKDSECTNLNGSVRSCLRKTSASFEVHCKMWIKPPSSFMALPTGKVSYLEGETPCRIEIAPGFSSCLSLQALGEQDYAKVSSRNLRFGSHSFSWMFTCLLLLVHLFTMHGRYREAGWVSGPS